MRKRFLSIFISLAAGGLACAALLALANHPAGIAWAAPEAQPLADTWVVGGACATIQACIDAAQNGDEVHIPAGRYTESVTIVEKAISITGDLSSTTIIHALDNQRVMLITNGATVYLAELMLTGGVVTTTNPDYLANCGGGLRIFAAEPAVLHNVAIVGNTADCGGGLGAERAGEVTLDGVDIVSNTAGVGGGISAEYIVLELVSGSIRHNVSTILGGGIQQHFGDITMSGGEVFSNSSENVGGGVALYVGGTFTQTGGSIAANTAVGPGGGLAVDGGAVELIGGAILSNSAHEGGGVAIYSGALVITATRLLSNSALGGAGAIAQFDSSGPVSVIVNNSCIAGNGPFMSVANMSGPTIDARGNWWGAADGPSGAGPGSGDAVSSGVDFSGFLSTSPGCPTPKFDLAVAKIGTGSGSVSSTPAGINCGVDCTVSFYQDSAVTLMAMPDAGSTFAGWSGPCAGVGDCMFTISQPTQVTANFSLNAYTLTTAKDGNGSGVVSSQPAGINCGATCSGDFDYGTVVTLTAAPAAGSSFAGWAGACTGVGDCVVTISQAVQVTATFQRNTHDLVVTAAGSGNGTITSAPPGIDCGSTCSHAFDEGTQVTLTASPSANSTFTGWSGPCSGTGTCVVTMNQAIAVTANFYANSFPLTVQRAGNGTGTVTSSPAGINCGAACSSSFPNGATVTLKAKPSSSSRFAGWSGVCSGTGDCVVHLTQATQVTAIFTLKK